LLPQ